MAQSDIANLQPSSPSRSSSISQPLCGDVLLIVFSFLGGSPAAIANLRSTSRRFRYIGTAAFVNCAVEHFGRTVSDFTHAIRVRPVDFDPSRRYSFRKSPKFVDPEVALFRLIELVPEIETHCGDAESQESPSLSSDAIFDILPPRSLRSDVRIHEIVIVLVRAIVCALHVWGRKRFDLRLFALLREILVRHPRAVIDHEKEFMAAKIRHSDYLICSVYNESIDSIMRLAKDESRKCEMEADVLRTKRLWAKFQIGGSEYESICGEEFVPTFDEDAPDELFRLLVSSMCKSASFRTKTLKHNRGSPILFLKIVRDPDRSLRWKIVELLSLASLTHKSLVRSFCPNECVGCLLLCLFRSVKRGEFRRGRSSLENFVGSYCGCGGGFSSLLSSFEEAVGGKTAGAFEELVVGEAGLSIGCCYFPAFRKGLRIVLPEGDALCECSVDDSIVDVSAEDSDLFSFLHVTRRIGSVKKDVPLLRLPTQLYIEVLDFFCVFELLRIRLVSTGFNDLATDQKVWNRLCQRYFPNDFAAAPVFIDWRLEFVQRMEFRWDMSARSAHLRLSNEDREFVSAGDSGYKSARTAQPLIHGVVNEWCIKWTCEGAGTLHAGIGLCGKEGLAESSFKYSEETTAHTIGGVAGGVAVHVGDFFDVACNNLYVYDRKLMEPTPVMMLWFRLDCRSPSYEFYFAQGDLPFALILEGLDSSQVYYPAVSISADLHHVEIVQERRRTIDLNTTEENGVLMPFVQKPGRVTRGYRREVYKVYIVDQVPTKNIYGRTLTEKTVPMLVRETDTVLKMKHLIFLKTGIPTAEQILVYQGKQLSNDFGTIADYSIRKEVYVHILFRPRNEDS